MCGKSDFVTWNIHVWQTAKTLSDNCIIIATVCFSLSVLFCMLPRWTFLWIEVTEWVEEKMDGCLLQRRAEIHNLWRRNSAPARLGKSCKSKPEHFLYVLTHGDSDRKHVSLTYLRILLFFDSNITRMMIHPKTVPSQIRIRYLSHARFWTTIQSEADLWPVHPQVNLTLSWVVLLWPRGCRVHYFQWEWAKEHGHAVLVCDLYL